jgi:hypothetical protein|tara:strand:+ start:1481 stop:1780 length:300 start_codon:yes stop_codon:yes gene_type:complete
MRTFLTGALAALFLWAQSAHAQGPCMPYDRAAEKLQKLSNEVIVGRGVTRDGSALIEMWADSEDGAWTILRVLPNGSACLMHYGNDFHVPATPPVGEGT